MDYLRYPNGKPQLRENYSIEEIKNAIARIKDFPNQLKAQLARMSKEELATPYRPDGWTGNQVVHHLSDSHMHAYARTKYTLISQPVTIKGYNESEWALTPEIDLVPIEASVEILTGLHKRWAGLLDAIDEDYFESSYLHPDGNREWKLKKVVHLYAWHGAHHMAHLKLICP